MAAEQIIEEVAENLEEVAEATRQINTRGLGFFFVGLGVGGIAGFILGYRFNREKIKAEAFANSEKEVEEIREQYRLRVVANQPKPSVERMVEERGYSVKVEDKELIRPLKPVVPTHEPRPIDPRPPASVEIPKEHRTYRTTLSEKDKMDGWNFPQELSQRTPDQPFIIHQDEFAFNESGYQQVTYVYYVEDDVLADEDDTLITDRDDLIGANHLTRFGHGTDDYNILYIRNPVLELEIELCRSPGSYEEEVLGLDPNEPTDAEEN